MSSYLVIEKPSINEVLKEIISASNSEGTRTLIKREAIPLTGHVGEYISCEVKASSTLRFL
jgi:hypothetical protein